MSDIIVNKVIKGDETYLDLTNDTVSEGTLLKNRTAHNSEGIQIQGVMEEGGGSVTGVKGDDEPAYRDGDVNITAANIGTYTTSQIDALLNNKVDVHGTDSLMTNAEHVKLTGIEAGAEENIIESISLNGEEITPVNKAVALSVIDKDVDDLTNYYKKSEIDTSLGAKQNRVLASTLNIGGQTIGNVEGALSALNESKSDLVNGKVPVNELPVYQPVIGSIQSIGGIVPPSSSGDEDKYLRSDGTWAKPAGGGGGVSNYDDLTNRPKVNGTTLSGDKTGTQLGLQNRILSSTLSIGGQTVTEVEPALHALNNKPSGGGGSKITISTNETSLHGKTVTVTGTSETKTVTFDNSGKAEMDGFMDTGTVTITASDGVDTATATTTIPYFGNYNVTLSFWSATLSITTDSPELYGQTVTVKDSNNQTVATATMSAQGTATATVNAADTYTVSCVGDGVTVSESVTVSAETTYNVSLHLWTATVSISTSSADLYGATITVKKGGSTVGTTTFSAQGTATYKVHETGEYTFECTYSGQTYSDSVTVSAETSYSVMINTVPEGSTVTPTDDIQIWLACAEITDKSYTTLNEVLADSTTLAALMLSNNAVDYLVRSTTWANGITANSTAMTDIGMDDYCAETLSSDATWAAAIGNSQYMESVWNVKVPTMTSNNTPSGETNYYRVFDGATYLNTGVTEVQIGSNDNGGYVYYLFANNIKITPYQFKFASAGFTGATDWLGAFSGSIDVSDDGTNWITVDSHTWTQAEHVATYHNPQSYQISNPNHLKGRYIRLNIPMGNYTYDRQTFVGLLNFYGRSSS